MTEKYLADYNDVFADIINVLLFDGKEIVAPEHLRRTRRRSIYKADGSPHEEERDSSKFWVRHEIFLALLGLENQTGLEHFMPLRVIGYDGASYREQLLKGAPKKKYPAVTLVLYFGTEKKWNGPTRLSECFDLPKELEPYFNDYKINVFNIAFLPDETVRKFKSDFRIVADYFTQIRKFADYTPSREEMEHVDAVLKLMTVLTNDSRFEDAQTTDEKEAKTMCDVLDRAENRGLEKGEARLASLIKILMSNDRQSEMQLALSDASARQRLYEKYGIE